MTEAEQAKKIRSGKIQMACGVAILMLGIVMIAFDPSSVGAMFAGLGALFVVTGAAQRKAADKKTDERNA